MPPANPTLAAYGPKCFQANLPQLDVDTVLHRIYQHLQPMINTDTGGPAWTMDRNRHFVPNNHAGKYFQGTARYKVATLNGIVAMICKSISYGEAGTSLVVNFVDNLDWVPPAEHIVGTTMGDIDSVVQSIAGKRRWLMLTGGWRNMVHFRSDGSLDEPEVVEANGESEDRGPTWTNSRRFTFPVRQSIRVVVQAVQALFGEPTKKDWNCRWEWDSSGNKVVCVATKDATRPGKVIPLTVEGGALIKAPNESPEAGKLNFRYLTVCTADFEQQADGACLIQVTLEETIDPAYHYNHNAIKPETFIDLEAIIAKRLREAVLSS
jgi:hypothetical protein